MFSVLRFENRLSVVKLIASNLALAGVKGWETEQIESNIPIENEKNFNMNNCENLIFKRTNKKLQLAESTINYTVPSLFSQPNTAPKHSENLWILHLQCIFQRQQLFRHLN